MRAPKCNAAWECPPSRGRATDEREKESPLSVYDPKVEGRGLDPVIYDWGVGPYVNRIIKDRARPA
ncbi:hypothetical protein CRG98_015568 [Punica granatum]|uniref:Uncharacterized protein n=1 Tax=Punica granatum TaxID=22663 RepID=A0A2I0K8J9_PUNGR|nr:hypothetical protein CRG98_015568 [Punica granatum]